MTDRASPPTNANANDDWLDAVLYADGREHRAAYLDDAGFTAKVMAALPAPAALPAWRRPAQAALWAMAGIAIAVAIPDTVVDFARIIVQLVIGQRVSLTGIGTAILALGAATWAVVAIALRDD
jgi:hypothetical protein